MITRRKLNVNTIIADVMSLLLLLTSIVGSIYTCISIKGFTWYVVIAICTAIFGVLEVEILNGNYKIKNRYWIDAPMKYTKFKKTKINNGAYTIKKKFIQF